MVLIVCQRFDPHVEFVEPELDRRGLPWVRLHLSDFPTRLAATIRVDGGRVGGSLHIGDRDVALDQIRAVWYRRTEAFAVPKDLSGPDRKLSRAESRAFIEGLWRVLPKALWVSRPDAIRLASSKAEQLLRAHALGMLVPATCFSNDPGAIRAFWSEYGRAPGVVYKPHTPILIHRADRRTDVVYTTLLHDGALERLDEIRAVPGIFQALIRKKHDVRVTVVGTQVFACAIDSQENENTAVDWRGHDWQNDSTYPAHRAIDLPPPLEEGCRRMVASYGLQFGAIDFAVDADGAYYFLEINPNGQWVFVEEATGLPLRSALCDLLSAAGPETPHPESLW